MRTLSSSESTEGNPGESPKNPRPAMLRARVLPIGASLLACVWLLATPNPALAQHGGEGGGHSGGGGGHASGGGHPSGAAAPASHSGGAAPAAHPASPVGAMSAHPSAPAAPSSGGAAERGGAEAAPAPHVVYGGYGYFVRENNSKPVQNFDPTHNIWQEPPSRPPSSVTLAPRPNTSAAAQSNSSRRPGATRSATTGLSMAPPPGPIPMLGSPFAPNNFGFGRGRFFRRGGGGFGCFDFGFSSCFGYGFGYGLGYGYWGGGYDINPADFNAQDVVADNPWMGNYIYEGTEEAAEVEAATAPGPLTLIYLKDGTSYAVRDYWMDAGQLHYVTSYGADNSVTVDRIDLQRTVDENAKNGIEFTLRPAQPTTDKP
jgi:hypothetical protein